MKLDFKRIAPESIPAALAKAEKYRDLNQPEQAESITRDILQVAPDHKKALRELGLAISDQFTGQPERFGEAADLFKRIADPYETPYLLGLAYERLCRAQLLKGVATETLVAMVENALRCYAEAEARRPAGNDDAILRWNSILRLIERYPHLRPEHDIEEPHRVDLGDAPPLR